MTVMMIAYICARAGTVILTGILGSRTRKLPSRPSTDPPDLQPEHLEFRLAR
jgi:hypothetical protein